MHTGIGVCCGKMQACCFLLIRVLKRSKAGFNVKTKQLWWRKLMNLHQWHVVVTSTWHSYICDWASENESSNFIKFWHKISTFFNFVTLNEQSVQAIDIFLPLMNGLISNILQYKKYSKLLHRTQNICQLVIRLNIIKWHLLSLLSLLIKLNYLIGFVDFNSTLKLV